MNQEPDEIENEQEETETAVDPNVQEVIEQLPGYQEYRRERQSEQGLTFGDW